MVAVLEPNNGDVMCHDDTKASTDASTGRKIKRKRPVVVIVAGGIITSFTKRCIVCNTSAL